MLGRRPIHSLLSSFPNQLDQCRLQLSLATAGRPVQQPIKARTERDKCNKAVVAIFSTPFPRAARASEPHS